MQCPKCHASMEKVSFEGVEVDRCAGCRGIWFDFQEQQQLKGVKGAAAIDAGDKAIGRKMNLETPQSRKTRTSLITSSASPTAM